ncbi:MAG TPA: hypothetical protein PKE21_14830 [Flavobacteriales bacterium]|nr:hypothetical protein [Flavobacteriales bacterium]HMR28756.1 hypothetical protein [Flavobacteriales bacterium]
MDRSVAEATDTLDVIAQDGHGTMVRSGHAYSSTGVACALLLTWARLGLYGTSGRVYLEPQGIPVKTC